MAALDIDRESGLEYKVDDDESVKDRPDIMLKRKSLKSTPQRGSPSRKSVISNSQKDTPQKSTSQKRRKEPDISLNEENDAHKPIPLSQFLNQKRQTDAYDQKIEKLRV